MTQHHMTPQEADALFHDLEKRARVELKHHRRAYAFEGALLVAIGIAAALSPSIASIAVDVFIGWLLFVTGFVFVSATQGALSTGINTMIADANRKAREDADQDA